jgi:DNA-binding beta-propeller fold protein YncE
MNRSLLLGGTLVFLQAPTLVAQRAANSGKSQPAGKAQAPQFEVEILWPKPMPNHWLLGSATGVAIDKQDHIFVVNLTDSFTARTEIGLSATPSLGECCDPSPNVLEYDSSGALVGHWGGPGQGYTWPEQNSGLAIDGQGNVWIGGAGGADSRILKFSHDGKFIAEFGKAGPAPAARGTAASPDTAYQGVSPGRGGAAGRGGGRGRGRGGTPALPPNSNAMDTFGGPAGFSFDNAANEAYVADGYRNHRVAVIDMNTGAIKRYWGAYGNKPVDADSVKYTAGSSPKQFGPVRCAELSNDGMVYVCDTQNDRIQVFKKDGSFVKEKTVAPNTLGTGSVWGIEFSRDPQQKYLYVADGMNMKIHVLDRQSLEELMSFGDGGRQPGEFYAVHSVATDSKGNLYTVETYEGKRLQKFTYKGLGPAANKGVLWPSSVRAKP